MRSHEPLALSDRVGMARGAAAPDSNEVDASVASHRIADSIRHLWPLATRTWLSIGAGLKSFASFCAGLATFLASMGGLAAAGLIAFLLVGDLRRQSVTISEIDVPSDLTAKGYTSVVAESRLRDALNHYYNETKTKIPLTDLRLNEEPTVTVPALGLPFNFIADSIAPMFHISFERVSGEFTESHNKLWLQLRLNDRTILVRGLSDVSTKGADTLFALTAEDFFGQVEPYVVVAHTYTAGHEASARTMAKTIIGRSLSGNDENAVWAHIILGVMSLDHSDYNDAAGEFFKATALDRNNAVAHNELGRAYFSEGKLPQAEHEYEAAKKLAPRWASPLQGLGDVHSAQGNDSGAQAEYQEAIQLEHQ